MFLIKFQPPGRYYILPEVRLHNVTVKTAKQWNKKKQGMESDRRFVRLLLIDVYGIETLKESSVYGNKSSSGTTNNKLDESKLDFITEIFRIRSMGDATRVSNLTSIINRHCNNLRKHKPKAG